MISRRTEGDTSFYQICLKNEFVDHYTMYRIATVPTEAEKDRLLETLAIMRDLYAPTGPKHFVCFAACKLTGPDDPYLCPEGYGSIHWLDGKDVSK